MPDTPYLSYDLQNQKPVYNPRQKGDFKLATGDWQKPASPDAGKSKFTPTPPKAKANAASQMPETAQNLAAKKYTPAFPHSAKTFVEFDVWATNPKIENPYSKTRLISVKVKGMVSDAFMSNLKLHVVSVSPVLRMPKVMIYDLISANHQKIYGKGIVKIRPFFTVLIPHTCDQQIFVVAGGFRVSQITELLVIAATRGVDYGDKIALYLSQRKVVLKPTPPTKFDNAKAKKEQFDKLRLMKRLKDHARDTLTAMVVAILPRDAVADGTNIDPNLLRRTEDVVEQALKEIDIKAIFLAEIPETLPLLGPGIAAAGGVIKLGMATVHTVRAFKLSQARVARGKYPEFICDGRDGDVLFQRIMAHFQQQAKRQAIGAAKKFVEVGLRVSLPGSAPAVTTARLADQVYTQVLYRAREIYEVDLTNQMLRLAERADTSDGFYDAISCGHVMLSADVINRYQVKDLSGSRRTYVGEVEQVENLEESVSDLKDYAKEITKKSKYKVMGPY